MKRNKFLDKVLIVIALFLLVFIITMIVIFCIKDSVPDTLIISVFGACTGEVSVCGWIKTIKEKKHDNANRDMPSDDGMEGDV